MWAEHRKQSFLPIEADHLDVDANTSRKLRDGHVAQGLDSVP
jgi:hypothetical protein